MFGLDTKSLLIGAVVGGIVVPRLIGIVAARRGAVK